MTDEHTLHRDRPEAHANMQAQGTRDHAAMKQDMLAKWIWRDFANIILGAWLLVTPLTFGYNSAAITLSDILSGSALIGLGVLTLWPKFDLARWGICFVGIWLLFAPLVFWAPSAAAYNSDTLIGALVIAFSVLIPMMPGTAHHKLMMTPGPEIPPGWSYNPSTWFQRTPIIVLALISWFVARYMAAYQLGYIHHVWEPFFYPGTEGVLTSKVSRMWPVSDAGLGALSYLLEALSGFMGGETRWRTMPWMVGMFGILVVPLGITSIVLVVLQPVAVGTWCTLCLLTAAAMLVMIPLAIDEVVAMVQFLALARREGKPFWRTFWLGDTINGEPGDSRSPTARSSVPEKAAGAVWGVTVPWSLLVCVALGIWLLGAPAVFGSSGAAANSNYIIGALVITVAVTATAEVVRAARLLNVVLGLSVIVASLFTGTSAWMRWSDFIAGAALIALSIPRGRLRERYGAWRIV
ncbi:MAG TPA: vitamin K epoxide reductase family protein [Terriglobales bacterium]|nr:vitamin K epoxide reductase family protein [Terriglobales bacterium]